MARFAVPVARARQRLPDYYHYTVSPLPPFLQGWVASKLRVKAASIVSRVEVLPPGTFGTGSTATRAERSRSPRPVNGKVLAPTTVSTRRALPSSTGN